MANTEEAKPLTGEGSCQENKQGRSLEEVWDRDCDCVLVCDSGRKLPSSRYMLTINSKVMFEFLRFRPKDAVSSPDPVEIRMRGDSEEDVQLLWQLWHGQRYLLDVIFNVRKLDLLPQTLERIMSVARMADKYQSEGECMQALLHK